MRTAEMRYCEIVNQHPQVETQFTGKSHHSSALIMTELDYMKANRNNPHALKMEHRLIYEDMRVNRWTLTDARDFYSWYMGKALSSLCVDTRDFKECRKLFEISENTTTLAVYDWYGLTMRGVQQDIPELILLIYSRKTKMDDVFDKITYSEVFHQPWPCCGMKGRAYGNLHVVDHRPGRAFVITHAHLAGIRDMISSWFSVLCYSHLFRDKYVGTDLYDEVTFCIKQGVDYAVKHPVHMYDLMKMWPSLCIGAILRDKENYKTFISALLPDVPHVEHPLVTWILKLVTTDEDVHVKLEMCGLGKMYGHPIVDMDESINTWIQKGTVMKPGKR